MIKATWEIGRRIIEYEQHGKERAEYGSELLTKLSKDLRQRYGKGFGRRNVLDMRRFYLAYQKWQTVSAKLSWSHYIALVSISDDTTRKFYKKHTPNEKVFNSQRQNKTTLSSKKYLDDACCECGEVYKIKKIVICWFTVLYYSNENILRRKQDF